MRRATRRHGIAVVWAAITLLVLIMFTGLALDVGYVHYAAHQLQNAADAAALAGAARVKFNANDAVTQAVQTAARNYAARQTVQLDAGAGDVVVGRYDRSTATFDPAGTPRNAVKVIARRTAASPGGAVNLFFGQIFGVNSSDVARQAIAMSGGTLGAGVLVLNDTRQGAFSLNGNVTVNIAGGSIQVNSSHASGATSVTGTAADLNADQLRIHGGLSTSGQPGLPEDTYTGTTPVPDPLVGLPSPAKTTPLPAINTKNGDNLTVPPGYYPGGISLKNGSTVNLQPGVYVLGPPGVSANGGTLRGNGVMLYFTTGTNPTQFSTLDLGGGATVQLSPPTSGTYSGITMFGDRAAPLTRVHNMVGNSGSSISGTLYFPSTALDLRGTSDFIANQIIANTIAISGNGTLRVNYDGRNPVEINNVFLVK